MTTNNYATDETNLLQAFYWFHRHPELSFQEFSTTEKIRKLLTYANIKILDLPIETGLVAEISGTHTGPVVAIRCDIDALPVKEQTNLPYKSVNDGKMHACGHDFHTTAIIGTALILKHMENDLKGTVRIIFQPGEESSLGALKIQQSGALSDVQAIFGIHVIPNVPVGTVVMSPGAMTAAVDRFAITFTGKGGHAAHPEISIDPIITAAQFISAVQTIVSRNINPFNQSLISITHVTSGSTWNVIPSEAFAEGTVRTLQKEDRAMIPKRLEEIAANIAEAFRAKADFSWTAGPPATNNDPDWTKFAMEIAEESGLKVIPAIPSLGGEDFAFYQQNIRGVYIQIGTGQSESNHNPRFHVDPKALPGTSSYIAALTEKALQALERAEMS